MSRLYILLEALFQNSVSNSGDVTEHREWNIISVPDHTDSQATCPLINEPVKGVIIEIRRRFNAVVSSNVWRLKTVQKIHQAAFKICTKVCVHLIPEKQRYLTVFNK